MSQQYILNRIDRTNPYNMHIIAKGSHFDMLHGSEYMGNIIIPDYPGTFFGFLAHNRKGSVAKVRAMAAVMSDINKAFKQDYSGINLRDVSVSILNQVKQGILICSPHIDWRTLESVKPYSAEDSPIKSDNVFLASVTDAAITENVKVIAYDSEGVKLKGYISTKNCNDFERRKYEDIERYLAIGDTVLVRSDNIDYDRLIQTFKPALDILDTDEANISTVVSKALVENLYVAHLRKENPNSAVGYVHRNQVIIEEGAGLVGKILPLASIHNVITGKGGSVLIVREENLVGSTVYTG